MELKQHNKSADGKAAGRVRAICLVRQRVYYFASKIMGSLLGRKSFQGRLQAKSSGGLAGAQT